jgi:hypothetical protein
MQLFWGDGAPCWPRALTRPCTLHPSTACAEGLGAVIAHRFLGARTGTRACWKQAHPFVVRIELEKCVVFVVMALRIHTP